MDLEHTFYIQSKFLKLVEPLLVQYYDFDSSMVVDEIKSCVENSGVNYINIENGILTTDHLKTFYDNETLAFPNPDYPFKDIADENPAYFNFESESLDKESIKENYIVYICLSYIGYVYYKEKSNLFNQSILIEYLDLEYQSVLHTKIYPEILSLYRLILESKNNKKKATPISLIYKQDKIDINSCAWFLDDMETYFKDRFPDLTLDKINELLPPKSKAGRKFTDRITTNIIWGTYQLLKNHHSTFKNSNVRISNEICQFIINYLTHIGIEHDLVDTDIKDTLKDMLKRNYIPKWNLPWRNVFSNIEEKQSESEIERLNQPLRKYKLSNL